MTARPVRQPPPPPRKPTQTLQFKIGLGLGIAGFMLWLVNTIYEVNKVLGETRRIFEEPPDLEEFEDFAERSRRFEEFDRRLDEMLPEDRGLAPTPTFPADEDKIVIQVSTGRDGETNAPRWHLRIDRDAGEYLLPAGWKGRRRETAERVAEYEATLAQMASVVRWKVKRFDVEPEEVRGEIDAARAGGPTIDHTVIVDLLDLLMEAGITDVVFDGQAMPLHAESPDDDK